MILAAHSTNDVYISTDGGQTWSTFNEGLTNTLVYLVTTVPSEQPTFYAMTAGGEIFTNRP